MKERYKNQISNLITYHLSVDLDYLEVLKKPISKIFKIYWILWICQSNKSNWSFLLLRCTRDYNRIFLLEFLNFLKQSYLTKILKMIKIYRLIFLFALIYQYTQADHQFSYRKQIVKITNCNLKFNLLI